MYSTQVANNDKICNTLYCKFPRANQFMQNASVDFGKLTLVFVTNFWIQLMKKHSFRAVFEWWENISLTSRAIHKVVAAVMTLLSSIYIFHIFVFITLIS